MRGGGIYFFTRFGTLPQTRFKKLFEKSFLKTSKTFVERFVKSFLGIQGVFFLKNTPWPPEAPAKKINAVTLYSYEQMIDFLKICVILRNILTDGR